jgi:hypothetical protein
MESAFVTTTESIRGYHIQVSASSGSFEICPAIAISVAQAFPRPLATRSPRREIPRCSSVPLSDTSVEVLLYHYKKPVDL